MPWNDWKSSKMTHNKVTANDLKWSKMKWNDSKWTKMKLNDWKWSIMTQYEVNQHKMK